MLQDKVDREHSYVNGFEVKVQQKRNIIHYTSYYNKTVKLYQIGQAKKVRTQFMLKKRRNVNIIKMHRVTTNFDIDYDTS